MGSGVLLQRTGSVDAVRLHGRCRELRPLAVLFVVGGFALAGLPPFGLSAGKALLESAVHDAGIAWLPIVFGLASALDGASVLRVAGSVFWGLGQDPTQDAASTSDSEKRESGEDTQRSPLTMLITAFVALALCLVAGVVAPFHAWAQIAGGIFLHRAPTAIISAMTPHDAALNVAVAAGAAILAVAALYLPRYKIFSAPVGGLRALHSGAFPDYVTWIAVGVVLYGGVLLLV
jgi:multicomponent Na+:H+ antiporter subunit D